MITKEQRNEIVRLHGVVTDALSGIDNFVHGYTNKTKAEVEQTWLDAHRAFHDYLNSLTEQ